MNSDLSGLERSLVRLRLRNDLRCTLQTSNGQPFYLIEDPLRARFYRFGLREWEWARKLDGSQTVREALVEEAQEDGEALTVPQKQQLCQWLLQMELVSTKTGDGAGPREPTPRGVDRPTRWQNPLFLRIPLFNPDRFLARCLPWFRWTLTPIAFLLWCLTGLIAAASVWAQGDRFGSHVPMILSADNWLYLLAAWILLKAVHEFYHGLVCKKYGGYVPRCGIVLILFSPVAFVDVTSSWRFRSKWHRIYTAAAGMYVELFVASIAALIWCRVEPGRGSQFAHNLVTMAGLSTVLFNGNFLMRFDGYYILSDLFGFQNLYGAGQQYLRYFWRRYLFGVAAQPLEEDGPRLVFVRVYAWATLVWRCLFYFGLLLVSAAMFQGAGILLAAMAAVAWFLQPSLRLVRYLIVGRGQEQPRRRRLAVTAAVIGLLLLALLIVPWPGGVSAWGVVDYEPLSIVRIRSPGFVEQVHVQPGQLVEPGQLLVSIENPQTRLELAQLDLAIEQSRVRSRMLHSEQNVVQYQVEQKNCLSLEQQRAELLQRTEGLTIRAPSRGHVIGRNLESLKGQYLPMGTEILSVGNEEHKQIRLSVAQRDADHFLQQIGSLLRIRIKGHSGAQTDGRLAKVNPRATSSLPHPALAAHHGGPLPVRPVAEGAASGTWELAEPRFLALVSLPASNAADLRAGELARVRIQAPQQSIVRRLLGWIQDWMDRKLRSRGLGN